MFLVPNGLTTHLKSTRSTKTSLPSVLRRGLAALIVLSVAMLATNAQATIITFDASIEFSGGTAPVGSTPWVTAKFDDGGGTGTVTLTLTALHLTGSEFATEWDFNLDPSLNPANLSFSAPTKTGSFGNPGISKGVNAFKADGDGDYDISFGFPTSGGDSDRFGVGDSVQYTITGIASLTANSFDFDSAPDGGHGPFRMAAHVQGIGASGSKSGWVAPDPENPGDIQHGPSIPEPSTFGLGIVGAAAVGCLIRRRRIA